MNALAWLLRLALYVTFSLGVGRLLGLITDRRVWELHLGLGILIAVLALIVLRPRPGQAADRLRQVAQFWPLLPLAIGLAHRFGPLNGPLFTIVHVLLGIVAVGLVEAALTRQKRAGRPEPV